MQATQITGFSAALRGQGLQAQQQRRAAAAPAAPFSVQAATVQTRRLKVGDKAPKAPPPPPPKRSASSAPAGTLKIGGTRATGTAKVGGTRKVTAIEVFSKDKTFRAKQQGDAKAAPKILSRIQELRLLSKLEQSGLLSAAERSGVTLSALEKSGLLSTAERLGAVSLLGDRNVPGTLYALASALLVAGPAAVYFLPDDSAALVAVQALIALTCVAGGSAAWGGATLLSTLQKS